MSENLEQVRVFQTIDEFNSYILRRVLLSKIPYESIELSRTTSYDGQHRITIELNKATKFSILLKAAGEYYEEHLYKVTVVPVIEMREQYQVDKIVKIIDLYNQLRGELGERTISIRYWSE